jgi:hypothetical protein
MNYSDFQEYMKAGYGVWQSWADQYADELEDEKEEKNER